MPENLIPSFFPTPSTQFISDFEKKLLAEGRQTELSKNETMGGATSYKGTGASTASPLPPHPLLPTHARMPQHYASWMHAAWPCCLESSTRPIQTRAYLLSPLSKWRHR